MSIFRRLPRWLTIPLAVFLFTRLLVIGGLYLPQSAGIVLQETDIFKFAPIEEVPVALRPWARWDSSWYIRISEEGYTYVPGSTLTIENEVAFFPLYPLLLRIGSLLISNRLLVGLIISNVCFLSALILLYRLTEAYFDSNVATRSVLYIAIFPTSFFFSAVYTESLFLLLSVLTAWFAYKHQWKWAALSGAFASATRAQGVLLVSIVALEWAKVHGWQLTNIHRWETWTKLVNGIRTDFSSFASIILLPSGLLIYMIYLQSTFGNAFAFNDALRAWGRQTVGPFTAIASALTLTLSNQFELSVLPYYRILEIVVFFVCLMLSFWVYRRIGISYAVYCIASVWVSASGRIEGQMRYCLVLFPLFMILAAYAKPRFNMFYASFCVILLPLFAFFFTNWIFVG